MCGIYLLCYSFPSPSLTAQPCARRTRDVSVTFLISTDQPRPRPKHKTCSESRVGKKAPLQEGDVSSMRRGVFCATRNSFQFRPRCNPFDNTSTGASLPTTRRRQHRESFINVNWLAKTHRQRKVAELSDMH